MACARACVVSRRKLVAWPLHPVCGQLGGDMPAATPSPHTPYLSTQVTSDTVGLEVTSADASLHDVVSADASTLSTFAGDVIVGSVAGTTDPNAAMLQLQRAGATTPTDVLLVTADNAVAIGSALTVVGATTVMGTTTIAGPATVSATSAALGVAKVRFSVCACVGGPDERVLGPPSRSACSSQARGRWRGARAAPPPPPPQVAGAVGVANRASFVPCASVPCNGQVTGARLSVKEASTSTSTTLFGVTGVSGQVTDLISADLGASPDAGAFAIKLASSTGTKLQVPTSGVLTLTGGLSIASQGVQVTGNTAITGTVTGSGVWDVAGVLSVREAGGGP
jgi:hypothetical protein